MDFRFGKKWFDFYVIDCKSCARSSPGGSPAGSVGRRRKGSEGVWGDYLGGDFMLDPVKMVADPCVSMYVHRVFLDFKGKRLLAACLRMGLARTDFVGMGKWQMRSDREDYRKGLRYAP